jgi:hypothetical protein
MQLVHPFVLLNKGTHVYGFLTANEKPREKQQLNMNDPIFPSIKANNHWYSIGTRMIDQM